MMPDQTRPFQIETDASKYATGAVLTQLDSNGDRHPISFISKTFSQQNGTTKSMIVNYWRALEEWRHYIQGSPHTTIILSDHVKTRIDSNSGASELRSFGDELCKWTWLQLWCCALARRDLVSVNLWGRRCRRCRRNGQRFGIRSGIMELGRG